MKFFDSESDAVFLSQFWSFPRSIPFSKTEGRSESFVEEVAADSPPAGNTTLNAVDKKRHSDSLGSL